MRLWVMTLSNLGCRFFFSDHDVGAVSSKKIYLYNTFNITFESTSNNQQYGIKFTCTEVRKKVMVIRNVIQFGGGGGGGGICGFDL